MKLSSVITKNEQALSYGMTGNLVKIAQQELAKRGYALKGTGWFGPATDTAVTDVQKLFGLEPDGELGPDTAIAIDNLPLVGNLPPVKKQEVSQPLWVKAGLKLLGTKEKAGAKDNPTIIDWAQDLGGSIEKVYDHDSIPWCALYMNHILSVAGEKGTGTLWALDFAGKWPSIKLQDVAVGAISPMTRDGGGHVTCIVGKDQHGNFMGLGGNQSDAVTIAPFARSRLNKGFWWPKNSPLPKNIGFNKLPIINSSGKISTNEA